MKNPVAKGIVLAYLMIMIYLAGATACMDRPEPDCEPPDPSLCEFDGQVIWPEPLCAYECVFESRASGPREI